MWIFQRKGHLFLTHIPPSVQILFSGLRRRSARWVPNPPFGFYVVPYVAAFFALERATTQGAVWAVNPKELVNVTERLGRVSLKDP